MKCIIGFKDFTNMINENELNTSRDPSMFDYTEKMKGGVMSGVVAVSKDEEGLSEFQVNLLQNIDDMAEQFYIIDEISNMAKNRGDIIKDEMRKLPSQFFDEIDDLATKVLETKKFAITISKRNESGTKVNWDKAWEQISIYINENKQITDEILNEIKEKFTSITPPRASSITIKPKMLEISDRISTYIDGVKGALDTGDISTRKLTNPNRMEDSEWGDYIKRNKISESKFLDAMKRTWENLMNWLGIKINTIESNLQIIRGMVEQSDKYGRKNIKY